MSSGRGPGVIGMLMALLVIGGFGVLFMFAFDSEMQGKGVTIESVIREQAKEIDEIKYQIDHGTKALADAPRLEQENARWDELKRENVFRAASLKSLKEDIDKAQETYIALNRSLEDYKNEYRTHVRSKAVGETFPELTTKAGSTYKRVEIRTVSAIGIQIRHEYGQKRIPFEELPEEMQERFQFDVAGKELAIAAENKHREEHEAAVAVANQLQEKDMEAARARQEVARRTEMKRSITQKQNQISQLQSEIQSLELQISQANAQAAAARASGRMVLTKIGSLRPQIRAKHNQIFALKNEIAALHSALGS